MFAVKSRLIEKDDNILVAYSYLMAVNLMNKMTNQIEIENIRKVLAGNMDEAEFVKTYSSKQNEIKADNSSLTWTRLLEKGKGEKLDFMTKDRVLCTSKILCDLVTRGSKTVIDIGIGNGLVEESFLRNCFYKDKVKITGIDISNQSLEVISKKMNVKTVKGNLVSLPKKIGKFDVVMLLEVLEHIGSTKTFQALGNVYSILNSSGYLIISVPLNEDLKRKMDEGTNISGHVRRYTPEIIKYELLISGFQIISEKYFFAFSNFYKLKSVVARILPHFKPNVGLFLCQKK